MSKDSKSVLQIGEVLAGASQEKIFEINLDLTSSSDEEVAIVAPVKDTVQFIESDDGVVGMFTLTTSLKLLCSVDGEEFTEPIHLKFSQEFLKNPSVDEPSIDRNNTVDIKKVVRDEIIVNIPMRPLCSTHNPLTSSG